jgi:hypothetical protein
MPGIHLDIVSVTNDPELGLMPPLMTEVHLYWKSACRFNFAPRIEDFHLDQIPFRALPWCAVVNVHDQPMDFIYRFFGTSRARMQGEELTGKSVNAMKLSRFADKAFAEYRKVVETRSPVHISTDFTDELGGHYDVYRAPICDKNDVVARILTFTEGGPNFSRIYTIYGTDASKYYPTFNN